MLLLTWLLACTAPTETETDDTDQGACGEVSEWVLTLHGAVEGPTGAYEGATVVLEDRGWSPGTELGEATTGADGRFTMDGLQVTSVERCWGTLLDYVVVATDGDMSGEKGVNTYLYDAIDDGSLVADASAFPVDLE